MILASNTQAETKLDPMFSDHMVLQREMPVPIWGMAEPGQKVTVSFRDQKKEATADKDGKWRVNLDPLKIGRPGKLTVTGKTALLLDDVLVGDGLVVRHSDPLQGFEIAGKDTPWHWAEARIEGDTVLVSSDEVPHPVHVRYKASTGCPWANLFNKDRWPAFAFTTR